MNIIWKIGQYRFNVGVKRLATVEGFNSRLADGSHILCWDFDNVPLPEVEAALLRTQKKYYLSDIYIVKTSPGDNFHAYCFTREEWKKALMAVWDTDLVDQDFVRFALLRQFFTLRLTPKDKFWNKAAGLLESPIPPSATVDDVCNFVKYETLHKVDSYVS